MKPKEFSVNIDFKDPYVSQYGMDKFINKKINYNQIYVTCIALENNYQSRQNYKLFIRNGY